MSAASYRFQTRRKAIKQLASLFDGSDPLKVIHYSCESFYDRPDGSTPRITSIAVHNHSASQVKSFSIHKVAEQRQIPNDQIEACYNDLEKQMLDEFYEFVRYELASKWVNWNMRDINFGFPAIEHRYKILGGLPTQIPPPNQYNLGNILPRIYGRNYSGHPRLHSLIRLNEITDTSFLSGQEEADAFDNCEYVKLHQSTLRKVKCIAAIAELAWGGTLKTNTNWYERHGSNIAGVVEGVTNHWTYKVVGAIGIIVSLVVAYSKL